MAKDLTYVVAGGANGIGAAISEALRNEGFDVYVLDIATLEKDGTNLKVDLSDEGSVIKAAGQLPETIGGLVLSIGVMRRGTILESSEADYDLLMDSNVKATWLAMKHLVPRVRENGTVVQLSSGHVLDPEADPGIYTLSKKAVTSLAEILELTRPDLDVKYVYPGPVLTNLLLQGRNEEDRERITKIAQNPEFIAKKTVALIKSDKKSIKFDPKKWDYYEE